MTWGLGGTRGEAEINQTFITFINHTRQLHSTSVHRTRTLSICQKACVSQHDSSVVLALTKNITQATTDWTSALPPPQCLTLCTSVSQPLIEPTCTLTYQWFWLSAHCRIHQRMPREAASCQHAWGLRSCRCSWSRELHLHSNPNHPTSLTTKFIQVCKATEHYLCSNALSLLTLTETLHTGNRKCSFQLHPELESTTEESTTFKFHYFYSFTNSHVTFKMDHKNLNY